MILHGQPVRASPYLSIRFTLLMASSSRFGSHSIPQLRAIHTRFRSASEGIPLRRRNTMHSPAHSSIGTRSPLARLPLFVGIRFQIYFTVLTGLLFTFPSRYSFTIGLLEYLALGVSAPRFIRAILVSNYSGTVTRKWS